MEKKEGSIDNVKKVIVGYMMNPDRLKEDIEHHNMMVHQLNEKIIKLIQFTPVFHVMSVDENGDTTITESRFDASTHELLTSLRKQNEDYLRRAFPNLYVYTDHLNDNDGEINESMFR